MRRKKEKKENSERWLLTYSDLITLLMILFVLLYSISNLDLKKFEKLSVSLNDAMGDGLQSGDGVLEGNDNILPEETTEEESTTSSYNIGTGTLTKESEMKEVKEDILSVIEKSNLEGAVDISFEQRGMIITVADSIMFDGGMADIKPEVLPAIQKIASILQGFPNLINIEGHTESATTTSTIFKSNWELSSIRATNVVQYLVDVCGIEPSRLSAVGYGGYRPIASNDTEEGRNLNRRVNFVILYETAESSTE